MIVALEGPEDAETAIREGMLLTEIKGVPADAREWLSNMPDCCQRTLGVATENLAVLARDLFAKAEDTLDEARKAATGSQQLVEVAKAYLELAEATA